MRANRVQSALTLAQRLTEAKSVVMSFKHLFYEYRNHAAEVSASSLRLCLVNVRSCICASDCECERSGMGVRWLDCTLGNPCAAAGKAKFALLPMHRQSLTRTT